MSLRTKFFLTIGIGGVLFLLLITILVFGRMESVLEDQLEQKFRVDAIGRLNSFGTYLESLTSRFESVSNLPMFKSMRFHELTLNSAAFKNDIRQLELFALKMIDEDSRLTKVQYVMMKVEKYSA